MTQLAFVYTYATSYKAESLTKPTTSLSFLGVSMALPVPVLNQYIDMINRVNEENGWNAQISAALKASAYGLRDSDISDGDMLLGVIYAMDGDVQNMRKCFTNAKAFHADNTTLLYNYGVGLYNNGLFSESIEKLLPIHQYDKNACRVISNCCKALGLEAKARQFYEMCQDNIPYEMYYTDFKAPKANSQYAFDAVATSMERDSEIWQDLSNR